VAEFLANPDLQSPVEPVSNINAIIDGRRANLGSMRQQGLDVNLGYNFDTSFGDWHVGLDAAKILDLTRATAPGLPYVDVLDTFQNPVDLRARATVSWRLNSWAANAYVNYVDGYRNTAINPNVEVDSYETVDASITYNFGEERGTLSGLSLSLNGQNLFDEDPPVVLNGLVSWDNQNVSPLGRFVSFVVTKRW
jgi:iron complex outermembrane receptor protein